MRKTIVRALAVGVLFLVAGGQIATATIPDSGSNYFEGCYLKDATSPLPKGNLRLINTDNGASCTSDEKPVVWNQGSVVVSDRNAKSEIASVNPQTILAKLDDLPVSAWSYKTNKDVRHIGPMAQDFNKLFAVGVDSKHLDLIDTNGVTLAAVKGLRDVTQHQQAEIRGLQGALAAARGERSPASISWLSALLAALTIGSLAVAVFAVRGTRRAIAELKR